MDQTDLVEPVLPVHADSASAQRAAADEPHPARERAVGLVIVALACVITFIAFAGWTTATLLRAHSPMTGALTAICGLAIIESLIWVAAGTIVVTRAGHVVPIVRTARWAMPARVGGFLAAAAWGVLQAV